MAYFSCDKINDVSFRGLSMAQKKQKREVKSNFLQEANGNYSLMRLMSLIYVFAFAIVAGYSVWKGTVTGIQSSTGIYVGVIYLLAAVLGKNLQKIVEEKGESLYLEGARERTGFLNEDNGTRSFNRLMAISFCIISVAIGGVTVYYGYSLENYQGDGTLFTLVATLGAVCPKLLQKVLEENYSDIIGYTKDKLISKRY